MTVNPESEVSEAQIAVHWREEEYIAPPPHLAAEANAAENKLLAIERVLVDVDRESPRDVLRHPAGLNDTLVDMINTSSTADMAPTAQAEAVSRETMARVDKELAKLNALLAGDVSEINRAAAKHSIVHIGG